MPTVVDDNTGEEVEVKPVYAVASIATINSLNSEFPPNAAKRIEGAMAAAAHLVMADGVTDPEKIKEAMMRARESMKAALRNEMRDARSQAAAEAQQGQ